MRILLLGHGRCGSTSFHLGLSEILNLSPIIEPFNEHLWNDYYEKPPPYIEGDDIPDNTMFKCINGPSFNNDWILENYKNFDKVIMLIRGNIKETLVSHSNAIEYGYSNKYRDTNPITKQGVSYVSSNYQWLFDLYVSSDDIDLLWYEDLYTSFDKSKQTLQSLGLGLSNNQLRTFWSRYLNPRHRLRQT